MDLLRVEEETADLYADSGRPAYPASVLFRMLFLKYYASLSDVQVARHCRYNLLYRAFVDLGIGESTPDDTTLVVFRRRLGEERVASRSSYSLCFSTQFQLSSLYWVL